MSRDAGAYNLVVDHMVITWLFEGLLYLVLTVLVQLLERLLHDYCPPLVGENKVRYYIDLP